MELSWPDRYKLLARCDSLLGVLTSTGRLDGRPSAFTGIRVGPRSFDVVEGQIHPADRDDVIMFLIENIGKSFGTPGAFPVDWAAIRHDSSVDGRVLRVSI